MEQMALNLGRSREVFTVSELTTALRAALEDRFTGIWVAGEISGSKMAPSGHAYFTLKDEFASLQCVCYRNALRFVKFKPKDGIEVLARGRLDLYEQRGGLQFVVEALEPQGHGALQLAFEQLKKKLAEEGLFATERKRALPECPVRIGIVTSPTGAVIQDILHVLERRMPGRHLRIYPTLVQGEGSVEQVCRGLRYFSESGWAEVVIVARGGGSLEDLWTFNEEAVARAIAGCSVPVISAIGHETDFTIADFVADLRAATPSAAAEMVLPAREAVLESVDGCERRLMQMMRYRLERDGRRLHSLGVDRAEGVLARKVNRAFQRVDDCVNAMRERWRGIAVARGSRLARLEQAVRQNDARLRLAAARRRTDVLEQTLRQAMAKRLSVSSARAGTAMAHLSQLSPLKILERGYAIVETREGRVVKSAADAPAGSRLGIRVAEGRIAARVLPPEEA